MTILKYSFPLAPPPSQPEARRRHDTPEFQLDLAIRWRRMPTDEDNALHFQSDADGALLIVSTDFLDTPDGETQALAEQGVHRRIEAIRASSDRAVQVLQQAIRPHASGAGVEMSFAAQAEGEPVHLHLGYVTARKILSFTMICPPDLRAAMSLFNATVPGFKPRLP